MVSFTTKKKEKGNEGYRKTGREREKERRQNGEEEGEIDREVS